VYLVGNTDDSSIFLRAYWTDGRTWMMSIIQKYLIQN